MSLKTQILAILVNIALLAIIIYLLYKRRLREEYSLIWLVGVFTLLILSIFRGLLIQIANILGIDYAPSLLFAVSGLFLLMIMISFAVSITSLVRKNRDLAQRIALLEWHMKQNGLEVGKELQRENQPIEKSADLDQE